MLLLTLSALEWLSDFLREKKNKKLSKDSIYLKSCNRPNVGKLDDIARWKDVVPWVHCIKHIKHSIELQAKLKPSRLLM